MSLSQKRTVVVIVFRFASCQTGDVDFLALQLTEKELSQVNVNDEFLHSVLPLANFLFFLVSSFFLLRRLSAVLDYRSSNVRDL